MEHAISYDTFAARPQPRLLHSVYSLIASILCLTSHKTQTSSKALDREIINQQAEQFFHHYGNHILRLATLICIISVMPKKSCRKPSYGTWIKHLCLNMQNMKKHGYAMLPAI